MSTGAVYNKSELKVYIPLTLSILEKNLEIHFLEELRHSFTAEILLEAVKCRYSSSKLFFLPDLARLELTIHEAKNRIISKPRQFSLSVNPTLSIMESEFSGLPDILKNENYEKISAHDDMQHILIFKNFKTGDVEVRYARDDDLLALKLIMENIDPAVFEKESGIPLKGMNKIIDHACDTGIILKPPSLIARDPIKFQTAAGIDADYISSDFFTLQWHITQECDLSCRHCYDRSLRPSVGKNEGFEIIDELSDFCNRMNVRGQISFTGGNPFLHPDFFDFYMRCRQKGLHAAILGNPVTKNDLERMLEIDVPEFYQISIEGLEKHNDYIRGIGHFNNAVMFLELLNQMNIYSIVMLTLTEDNIDQVIPLADILRDKADRFTFNRLAKFGAAVDLSFPDKEKYRKFLIEYLDAAGKNPVIGLKDNLINIIKHDRGEKLISGCAGYGCGAAFNFLALLPDGEVHACRKMPSFIGNLKRESLMDIYNSEQAFSYRKRPSECDSCRINHLCGGCPAVTKSSGLDISIDKDPMCFISV